MERSSSRWKTLKGRSNDWVNGLHHLGKVALDGRWNRITEWSDFLVRYCEHYLPISVIGHGLNSSCQPLRHNTFSPPTDRYICPSSWGLFCPSPVVMQNDTTLGFHLVSHKSKWASSSNRALCIAQAKIVLTSIIAIMESMFVTSASG